MITSVSISYSHDAKKLVGTFSCACGFVYSTTDTAVAYSDKLSFGKIKSFGKIWERKLGKLLVEKRVSLREAARQLKVDTKTVIRHAERLKLIEVKAKHLSENKSRVESLKQKEFKDVWLVCQRENLSLSKTELRQKMPDVYMRLYRNDRQWLERNSPQKRQVVYENQRVDWAERDEQILITSQTAVQTLRQKVPPVRITIGSVGKFLGLRALLEKHLDKLPNTKNFLASQTGTVEDFQIRRIRWAAYKISLNGEVVKEWQVIRLAGIKNSCSETVKQAITNIVLEANLSSLHLFKKTAS